MDGSCTYEFNMSQCAMGNAYTAQIDGNNCVIDLYDVGNWINMGSNVYLAA